MNKKAVIATSLGIGTVLFLGLKALADAANNNLVYFDTISGVGLDLPNKALWLKPSFKIVNASNTNVNIELLTVGIGTLVSGNYTPYFTTTPQNISIATGQTETYIPKMLINILTVSALFGQNAVLDIRYKAFGTSQQVYTPIDLSPFVGKVKALIAVAKANKQI